VASCKVASYKVASCTGIVLAHESGDPGVQFDEKTRGRKSRKTVTLKLWSNQTNFSHLRKRTC
jgi:hypothetical protein